MSTNKKISKGNSTLNGLKASNSSKGKLIDSIKESLNDEIDVEQKDKVVLPLFQFISDNVKITGGNNLKLHNAKAIIYECVANNHVEAFKMFKNDIKNKLNITSESDIAYVLHDMFGEQIHIVSTLKRNHDVIHGYRKQI